MQSGSICFRRNLAKVLLVGMTLSPVVLFAQTGPDPGAAVQDQQGPPPQGGPGHMDPVARDAHMLEHMTKSLKLSPDQVTQIQAIQADTRTQAAALRADTTTAGPDRHAKMMDLHKAENDKVRALLNDKQKGKFDEMQAKHQEHMDDRHDGGGPPPAPPQ